MHAGRTMVMSMDAAGDTQTMGDSCSPIDGSVAAASHQTESADDEPNEDEASKDSGQTVVANQREPSQQVGSISSPPNQQQQQQQQSSSMVPNLKLSATDDEQQLRMSVDDEEENDEEISWKKLAHSRPKVTPPAPVDDVGQDLLVARMRDIVEGGQQNMIQQQQLQQQQKQQQQQPDNSSGESLNNQTETNSKASVDSAQHQKRTRHSRDHQCARHGHHHHHHHHHGHRGHQHHRQSIGTVNNSSVDANQSGKATAGQQATHNRHHHHHHRPHHHHHHHHHHQSTGAICATESRRSSQQLSSKQDIASDTPANNHGAGIQVRSGELKSSTSSISSNTQHLQQSNTTIGSKLLKEGETIDAKSSKCEHHHHANTEHSQAHPHSHHHHHHHHQQHHHVHGRQQHNRGHKKRLVLDIGDDQIADGDRLKTCSSSNLDAGGQSSDRVVVSGNSEMSTVNLDDSRNELEPVGEQTSSKESSREPLKDLTRGHSNCCPHHEQHHHQHHHHHHNEARSGQQQPIKARNQPTDHHANSSQPNEQSEAADRESSAHAEHQHHHHHHHHRHHHNHGHHHHGHHEHGHGYNHAHGHHSASKQRHRTKHKSSGNTNTDDQQQQQQEKSSTTQQADDRDDTMDGKSLPAAMAQTQHVSETADSVDQTIDVKSATVAAIAVRTEIKSDNAHASGPNAESDSRMLLDQESADTTPTRTTIKPCHASSEDEVVRMDMSPANETSQMETIAPAETNKVALEQAPRDVASLERTAKQVDTSVLNDHRSGGEQPHGQQSLTDSDLNTQEASGNETTKRNSTTAHEFTRSQESDSVKENRDKHNKLVRQTSTPRDSSSQRDMGKADQQQQLLDDSSHEQSSRKNQRSSQPKQIVESTILPDRSSKLSWCCCCPCSSLSHRSNSVSKSDTKAVVGMSGSNANMCPALPNSVPLEEIRMWSDSFDRLMKCPDGRKVFQDFLRCEYSEENILFWIACEELKHEKDAKNIASKARDIYEDYISILSAKEVSLDSRVRDIINNNIKKPTSNIFDEAQLQIYTLMHRDSYPRFINSPMYKKLAQIQASSRKSSS